LVEGIDEGLKFGDAGGLFGAAVDAFVRILLDVEEQRGDGGGGVFETDPRPVVRGEDE